MFYANYDENTGEILGFYNDEIHTEIPQPYIELTNEEWKKALSGSYRVIDNVIKEYIPPVQELTTVEKITQAQTKYSRIFAELRDFYIAAEINNNSESMEAIKDKYNFVLSDFNNLIGFLKGDVPRQTYGNSTEINFCPVCGSSLNGDNCTNCMWRNK